MSIKIIDSKYIISIASIANATKISGLNPAETKVALDIVTVSDNALGTLIQTLESIRVAKRMGIKIEDLSICDGYIVGTVQDQGYVILSEADGRPFQGTEPIFVKSLKVGEGFEVPVDFVKLTAQVKENGKEYMQDLVNTNQRMVAEIVKEA